MLGLHKKARGCASAPRFAHGDRKSWVFEVGMGEEFFIFGWEGLRAGSKRVVRESTLMNANEEEWDSDWD